MTARETGTDERAEALARRSAAKAWNTAVAAVVAAAIHWRKADTADPSMWPDEQRELAEAVDALLDALLSPENGTSRTLETEEEPWS